jgi:hypothetical protein
MPVKNKSIRICCLFIAGFAIAFIGLFAGIHHSNAATTISIVSYNFDTEVETPAISQLYVGEGADYDVKHNDGDGDVYQGGTKGSVWEILTSNASILDYKDDSTGGFVAKSAGTVTLRVSHNGVTATKVVTVRQQVTSLSCDKANYKLNKTAETQITIKINPSNATYKSQGVTYSSANPSIATINNAGTLYAVSVGTTNVVATFENRNRYRDIVPQFVRVSCNITVTNPTVTTTTNFVTIENKKTFTNSALAKDNNTNHTISIQNSQPVTISGNKATGKNAGHTFIQVNKENKIDKNIKVYNFYITVYNKETNIVGIVNEKINLINQASTVSGHFQNVKSITKGSQATLIGSVGNYYYIKEGSKYGYIQKRYFSYIKVNTKRKTLSKNSKGFDIAVDIYNTKSHNITGNGTIVKIKKTTNKFTDKPDGQIVGKIVYRIVPLKEGTKNIVISLNNNHKKEVFVSVYSGIPKYMSDYGFSNNKATKYIIANKDHISNNPTSGSITKATKGKFVGECGGMFYLKIGSKHFWIEKSKISYIKVSMLSIDIYHHHNKKMSTTILNNSLKKKISLDYNKKLIKVSGKYKISGEKPTNKTTLKYKVEYAKGKYISKSVTIKVRSISIKIGKFKLVVGDEDNLKASVQTLPNAKVTFTSSNKNIVKPIEDNKLEAVGSGNATITAKYKDLKKKFKVTVTPLLIYDTVNQKTTEPFTQPNGKLTTATSLDLREGDQDFDTMKTLQGSTIGCSDFYTGGIFSFPCIPGQFSRFKIVNDFKNEFYSLIDSHTNDPVLKKIGIEMFRHSVEDRTGTDFTSPELNTKVKDYYDVKRYVGGVMNCISSILENKKISSLGYTISNKGTLESKIKSRVDLKLVAKMQNNGIFPPILGKNAVRERDNGFVILIHGIHANRVKIKSYKKTKKGYRVKLDFIIYDHFGLDQNDFDQMIFDSRFDSWYILQHLNLLKGKYKPFVTVVTFNIIENTNKGESCSK